MGNLISRNDNFKFALFWIWIFLFSLLPMIFPFFLCFNYKCIFGSEEASSFSLGTFVSGKALPFPSVNLFLAHRIEWKVCTTPQSLYLKYFYNIYKCQATFLLSSISIFSNKGAGPLVRGKTGIRGKWGKVRKL